MKKETKIPIGSNNRNINNLINALNDTISYKLSILSTSVHFSKLFSILYGKLNNLLYT